MDWLCGSRSPDQITDDWTVGQCDYRSIRQLDGGEFLQRPEVSRRFYFQPDAGAFRVFWGFVHHLDDSFWPLALPRRLHRLFSKDESHMKATRTRSKPDDGSLFAHDAQRPA